jgi:hypothetical protein
VQDALVLFRFVADTKGQRHYEEIVVFLTREGRSQRGRKDGRAANGRGRK